MMSPNQHKILHGAIVITILIAIINPHFVFGLLIEIAHLLFEAIESILDTIIELVFETGSRTTQIIVFYIMFTAGGYGCYRLYRVLPIYWRNIKHYLCDTYLDYKNGFLNYWRELSLFGKIKFVVISSTLTYLATLLLF